MIEDLLFFGYILCFGLIMSVFFLALVYYLKGKVLWKYKTLLFLAFCMFLFIISGINFYLEVFLKMNDQLLSRIFFFINNMLYALLIYYLPSTINYMLKRKWKINRLVLVILTSLFYFALSIVMTLKKSPNPFFEIILAFLLTFCIVVICIDAVKSLPLIEYTLDRIMTSLLFGVTFIFLPILLLGRFLSFFSLDYFQNINFLFFVHCLYFFWVAIMIIFYLVYRLTHERNFNVSLESRPDTFFSAYGITHREREIVLEVEKGYTNKEISAQLDISANTVSNHIASIYKKVGARSRVELLNILRKVDSKF